MAKNYEWRATTTYQSDTSLSYGVTPSTQSSWQTEDVDEPKSGTYTYWFRDSNTAWQGAYQDILSSRVALSITQSWTTSIDNRNNLTVTITTTVNSIVRDDIQAPAGYSDSNTPGRNITLYKEQGGAAVGSWTDNQVATAHTISGVLSLGTETFTLAPGQTTVVRPSLYLHNQTVGMSSYDDIWMGVQFRNPLPADYRPGKTWNGTTWVSHNRTSGATNIKTTSNWREMRTYDGGAGADNPPYIRHSNDWRNQRLIGQE